MSEENVEVTRRIYPEGPVDLVAVFSDPALLAAMRAGAEPYTHSDLEMVGGASQVPLGDQAGLKQGDSTRPTSIGIDGFIAGWADWLSAWESWVADAVDFTDVGGDRVLVTIDIQARSKTGGVAVSFVGANLLTFRDGKVKRIEIFTGREEALQAAGLSE